MRIPTMTAGILAAFVALAQGQEIPTPAPPEATVVVEPRIRWDDPATSTGVAWQQRQLLEAGVNAAGGIAPFFAQVQPAILSLPMSAEQRMAVRAALVTVRGWTNLRAETCHAVLDFICYGRWQDSVGLADSEAESYAMTGEQRGAVYAVTLTVARNILDRHIGELESLRAVGVTIPWDEETTR